MTVENGKRPFPSRREFISLGVGAFVVGSIPLARRGRRRHLIRRTLPVMGTLGEVAIVHGDERYAQGAIDAAFQELRRVEALLTRFRPDSEIGRANRLAFAEPMPVSRETAEVLTESLRWAEGSAGIFDPCLGRAIGLWDVGKRHQPPAVEEIRRYAGRNLYEALEVGRWMGGDVVLFHEEDMGVDLGGIGKGYGVDRAVTILRDWGVRDALVNLGGDLYAMGVSEDGDPWKVGVQSPDNSRALVATLPMSDRGVATSGDYQRYFEFGGRRYHHLLDPETGAPSQARNRSVTVAAPDCMAADAAATTAFVSSVTEAQGIMDRLAPGSEVVYTV
ncbi:MAG: FAD:protein FMN transferase [Longimicrobiales bacterium]